MAVLEPVDLRDRIRLGQGALLGAMDRGGRIDMDRFPACCREGESYTWQPHQGKFLPMFPPCGSGGVSCLL